VKRLLVLLVIPALILGALGVSRWLSTTTSTASATQASFVDTPTSSPAANVGDVIQQHLAIDALFQTRFGVPYYGGLRALSQSYAPHDRASLDRALSDMKRLTRWDYVPGTFDCSNMSALAQFFLTNAGFKTLIVVGEDVEAQASHSWVVVLIDSPAMQVVPIEVTAEGGPAIPDDAMKFKINGSTASLLYSDYVSRGWVIEDIYQAAAWATKAWGSNAQFNWWDGHAIDWSVMKH